ncbi:hypothetical protein DC083_05860 [Ignatzschineria ureiclastica]|uniref:Uncharacterized protein n=1 Tax=Ignatzschineria ureiclastica TaxID=472582 RepID=A0A2U2ADB5_9GAMM|nr:hypothetical protein [Ignatzschineria ureiclastica]PWD80648.1 hypothetical protein DC083_05860 [Ignatzschineria ureiclastica]GGZ95560.1 hypothetical protein GCM10007162_09820 [Ignatzschineria ureiclastica]
MNSENSSQNKKVSLSHNTQLRHLFKSLKALAFGMIVAGIILVISVGYMDLTPGLEIAILLFFGFAGGLYLVARGKSILLQHQVAEERHQKKANEKKISQVTDKEKSVNQTE